MARVATVADCLEILHEQFQAFVRLLPVPDAQLSFPTDGKGPRIKVSVHPGQAPLVPPIVVFPLHGEEVNVNLQVEEDFQDYELQ